jgi:Site-specific recombinases, DNA invertase Pin homologs
MHIYTDEAVSATTDQRDEFLKMVDDAKKGNFQLCVVHKLDRFARNRYDSAFYRRELEKCGVRVMSVLEQLDDSPESIILESVLEGMAEYYSKNLAREVRKGLNENALVAKHNGGIPPLGYDVTPEHGYKINEPEAQAVKIIFDMYCNGYGYNLICNELNAHGYKTKPGRSFGKGSISEILRNEKHAGVYVWNKRLSKKTGNRQYKPDDEITRIDGAIPQIISKETWAKTQSILLSRKKKPRNNQTHYYILTGKLVCADCGSAYVGSGYEYGRGKKKNYQYSCNGRLRHKGECMNKSIRCEPLEKYVLSQLSTVLSNDVIHQLADEMIGLLNKKEVTTAVTEKTLAAKLSGIKSRVAKTCDLYYDNLLPKEDAAEQIRALTDQQKNLEMQIANIAHHANAPVIQNPEIVTYLNKCKNDLQSNDKNVLRSLVDTFVDKVIVSDNDITAQIRISPKANADSDKVGGGDRAKSEHVYFINGMLVLLLNRVTH